MPLTHFSASYEKMPFHALFLTLVQQVNKLIFTLFVCRLEVQRKCIKSRRDSKSWRITTNLSGEKNRMRASPQETVILMKQTFEPFPLLSSTFNLKKGSQHSLNSELLATWLSLYSVHGNQTPLSDCLSHVSPVKGSVHGREFC